MGTRGSTRTRNHNPGLAGGGAGGGGRYHRPPVPNLRPPKGTDDVLPPESRTWRQVLRAWDDWSERFGYELVMTPLFEATDLFERGVGESTEVVRKQMYTFEDRGGRSVTLRPEGTASVVRAYLNAGIQGEWKGAYSGPMFRYERPQGGRRRQFWQTGVEHLGTERPTADAEVIELGYRFLVDLGVPGVEVQINSLGDAVDRPAYVAELTAYLEARRDQLCADSIETMAVNPLRVLDCKTCAPILGDAPTPDQHLGTEAAEAYEEVKARLAAADVPFVEAPRLVRGLDYYTRTAFEYVGGELDIAQVALGGGGRYDGLAEEIGGRRVPGVGLAMGIDRIIVALGEAIPAAALDGFVVTVAGRNAESAGLVSQLRRAGLRVDAADPERSVKSQFKAADRSGAPTTIVVGDEWDEGLVRTKRMADGTETDIEIQELAAWLS